MINKKCNFEKEVSSQKHKSVTVKTRLAVENELFQ